jgi:hypothetical protein
MDSDDHDIHKEKFMREEVANGVTQEVNGK